MNLKINKKGIALISLVVAIIVLIILASIVMYLGTDMVASSKRTVFANDINTIYDNSQEYYAVNGSLPILSSGKTLTAEDYINEIETLLGTKEALLLSDEINSNQDNKATFYEINIGKLGIEKLNYGIKKDNDEDDVFLISVESQKIYYYKGYKAGNKRYFSSVDV